jgi:hypothetical protein
MQSCKCWESNLVNVENPCWESIRKVHFTTSWESMLRIHVENPCWESIRKVGFTTSWESTRVLSFPTGMQYVFVFYRVTFFMLCNPYTLLSTRHHNHCNMIHPENCHFDGMQSCFYPKWVPKFVPYARVLWLGSSHFGQKPDATTSIN